MSWKGPRMSVPWTVAAVTLLFAVGTARAAAIKKLDTNSTVLKTRTDLCGTPVAVAVNGADVYVLTRRGWIYRLSSSDLSSGGTPPQPCSADQPQARLPDPPGGGTRPDAKALAVNPSTGDVYAGLNDGRIYRYLSSLGNNWASTTTVGTGVVGLTIDSANKVYVAYGNKIDKRNPDLTSSGLTPPTVNPSVTAIKAVATGPTTRDLYVVASDSNVHRFNDSLIERLPAPGALGGTGTPKGIAASGGDIIVATSDGLYKVGPTGASIFRRLTPNPVPGDDPVGVDLDGVGHVVAADSAGRVYVLDTNLSGLSNSSSVFWPMKSIAAIATSPTTGAIYVLGGPPGASEGDPHLTTTDGIRYDFQSAGEFVLLRHAGYSKGQMSSATVAGPPSPHDEMEIQVRQFPVATTANTCVSLNSAVAARVGKHRVTYEPNLSGQADPSGLQLRIDRRLIALDPSGIRLGDGGRIVPTSTPGGLEIDFPDDTVLFVTPGWWASQGKWYINVNVVPQQSSLGLAGNVPEGSWLPALPDGSSMGPAPGSAHDRYVALYERFADAWRVTDETSLFDYAPGTSTKTFTMRGWPPETGRCDIPGTVPVEGTTEEVARDVCKRVPGDPANCIFDVKVTGLLGFANTYLASRNVQPVPETKPKPRCAGGGTVALLTFLVLLALWMLWSVRRGRWIVLRSTRGL